MQAKREAWIQKCMFSVSGMPLQENHLPAGVKSSDFSFNLHCAVWGRRFSNIAEVVGIIKLFTMTCSDGVPVCSNSLAHLVSAASQRVGEVHQWTPITCFSLSDCSRYVKRTLFIFASIIITSHCFAFKRLLHNDYISVTPIMDTMPFLSLMFAWCEILEADAAKSTKFHTFSQGWCCPAISVCHRFKCHRAFVPHRETQQPENCKMFELLQMCCLALFPIMTIL